LMSVFVLALNVVVFSTLIVLATFSKEQGITPICIAMEFLNGIPRKKSFLTRCSLSFLRLYVNNFTSPKFTELDNAAAFLASYSHLWLINLRLLILPYSLCFDYSMGCIPVVQNWTDLRALALPTVLALKCVICITLSAISAVIGVITFLPASNLLVTVGFTVAERVLYLPSVGMCIIMARIFEIARRRIQNAEKFLIAVLVIAMTMTYQRCEEWRTELDLYASGLRVCSQNAKVHYNLGKVLSKIGDVTGAEHNYWNAIRLNPNYEHAMNNLANILEAKGRSGEAEILLRKALRGRPTFAVAWMNLGITLMNQGRYEVSTSSAMIYEVSLIQHFHSPQRVHFIETSCSLSA
uniref:dolichyl-phosphate-mannose--protein mannosyltransferase n=1 Tax=Haemonchus placei TaxID=6290 RepID=A0A0N4X428_HAEPC